MDGGPATGSVLDAHSFEGCLRAEVARVRRSGGFLSLVMMALGRGASDTAAGEARAAAVADRLRRHVRLHDVVALRGSAVALVLPDTTLSEATRAGERFLRIASAEGGAAGGAEAAAAGAATVFGEVEGGGEALMEAAEEALRAAPAGQVVASRELQGRPRILVVDDDLSVAEVLAESISERGWEGHPCSQVEDARQRVESGTYSGMFVDLVLPGASGVEIVRRSLAWHPRRPVVLMSGYDANHEAILDALSLGPVTFVAKPISSTDLDRTLLMLRELLPGAPGRRDARFAR